jgi:endonuclease/exonuclease/phosphatase family metal-dependent hydrolase
MSQMALKPPAAAAAAAATAKVPVETDAPMPAAKPVSAAAAAGATPAAPAAASDPAPTTLRVLFWNILASEFTHHNTDDAKRESEAERKRRFNQIIDVIVKEDPDVVCLQEVTPKFKEEALSLLGAVGHMYLRRERKNQGEPRHDGLWTLVRDRGVYGDRKINGQMVGAHFRTLKSPTDTRCAIIATVIVGTHWMSVVQLHLEGDPKLSDVRFAQAAEAAWLLGPTRFGVVKPPVQIVGGDFNEHDITKISAMYHEAFGLDHVDQKLDDKPPAGFVDHVFVNHIAAAQVKVKTLITRGADSLKPDGTRKKPPYEDPAWPSDHPAMLVEIRL